MSGNEHREQVARNVFNYVKEEVEFLNQYNLLDMNHRYLEEVAEEAAMLKWASDRKSGRPTPGSLQDELQTNARYLQTERGRDELEEIEETFIADWEPTPKNMGEMYANWILQPDAYQKEHGISQGYEKDERFKRMDNIVDRMRSEGDASMPTFKKALGEETTGPQDAFNVLKDVPDMHPDYLVGNYLQEKLGIETRSRPNDDELRPEEELAIGIRRVHQDPINWTSMALAQPFEMMPPSNESHLMEYFYDRDDIEQHLER